MNVEHTIRISPDLARLLLDIDYLWCSGKLNCYFRGRSFTNTMSVAAWESLIARATMVHVNAKTHTH